MSERLKAIADLVVPGATMADIGTDHAWLPVTLVRQGVVPKAIACDLRPGPLQHAQRHCDAHDCDEVELRLGNGLSVLAPGEASTVVLAGMGGALIERLVEQAPDVVERTRRLILQPNTQWPQMRRWLARRAWQLEAETLTLDRDQFYVTFAVRPRCDGAYVWDEADLVLGPVLRHERSATYQRWLQDRITRLSQAVARANANAELSPLAPELAMFRQALEQCAKANR